MDSNEPLEKKKLSNVHSFHIYIFFILSICFVNIFSANDNRKGDQYCRDK